MRTVLIALLLIGCGGKSDKTDTAASGNDSGWDVDDDWWDDDGDDDDKDDEFVGWLGFYAPSDDQGVLFYSDDGCVLSYVVDVEGAGDVCEACEFAYWMTVTSVEAEEDESCPSTVLMEVGTRFGFGHGTEVLGADEEATYYDLHWSQGDEWVVVETGFSVMTVDEEKEEPLWVFGLGPAAPDHIGWLGAYDLETGEAGISYNDEDCFVQYSIEAEAVEEECAVCQFAYWFTLTHVETERTDTTSCPDSVILEDGTIEGMGHGTTSMGAGYYSLGFYDETTSSWIELPTGFSYYEAGESPIWWFGLGPVEE